VQVDWLVIESSIQSDVCERLSKNRGTLQALQKEKDLPKL